MIDLRGKRILFTGRLRSFRRSQAQQLVSRGTLFRHPFVTLFRPETTLFRRTNVTFLIFNLVIRQIIPSVGLEY